MRPAPKFKVGDIVYAWTGSVFLPLDIVGTIVSITKKDRKAVYGVEYKPSRILEYTTVYLSACDMVLIKRKGQAKC